MSWSSRLVMRNFWVLNNGFMVDVIAYEEQENPRPPTYSKRFFDSKPAVPWSLTLFCAKLKLSQLINSELTLLLTSFYRLHPIMTNVCFAVTPWF